ncbi:MAG: hypothetical protein HUU57_00210 [Bdellovibrio sp.]|nr:hypothetical protein [Bdellovibrio sp.]
MKVLLVLASLCIGFSVQAVDKKLGNVIAVERDLLNLSETCIKNVISDITKPSSFFSCAVKFTTGAETPVSKGTIFKMIDNNCSVVAEAINGTLLVTFAGAKSSSSFEASRACLETALADKEPLKVLLYTVE